MPTEDIVALLVAERDKLNRAIEALREPVKRRGRPVKAAQAPASARTGLVPVQPRKRKMSAAARKAIGDATRKRWALLKAGKKAKAATVTAPAPAKRKPMTAAQKKALSVKMKAAWAQREQASG